MNHATTPVMADDKIKVLIADDSQVTRQMLAHLLNRDSRILVIGTVNDGQAAIDFLAHGGQKPDVVLMDIHMPRLDGFEATRRIMETHPLPIVICSATSDPRELQVAFRSIEAGAVACVEKPGFANDGDARVSNLLQTLCLMSEVKVVRRWPRDRLPVRGPPIAIAKILPTTPRIVGVGASTGGPLVLQTILSGLDRSFPAPMLIVQHIARGFLPGMVEWLNQTTGLQVHVAAHGASPLPGHVYIAPDDFHMGLEASGTLALAREPPENGLRPAVSWLFRSLALHVGPNAVGVILTGMGKDGAAELKTLRDHGAFTIAQDRDSSVVHGMPGAAIELGGASVVLPAERIAGALVAELEQRSAMTGEIEP